MAGAKHSSKFLNHTLFFIISLLHENNMSNWFIAYGTLLGIIRNNSCIEGDDEVDIVIDISHYDILKDILIKSGIEIEYGYGIYNSRQILKTKANKNYCSIDFYMASIDTNFNYHDKWENVIWSNCHELIEYNWKNITLYVPNNYETKLIKRYGENWRIPDDSKGVIPKKKVL